MFDWFTVEVTMRLGVVALALVLLVFLVAIVVHFHRALLLAQLTVRAALAYPITVYEKRFYVVPEAEYLARLPQKDE